MTALSPDQKYIQIEESKHRSANSESLAQKIGGSLNYASLNILHKLGDIVPAMLTEPEFQSYYGYNWVLCNGQSIAGSDLDTLASLPNAPDCRGKFVRGLDEGRGIDTGRVINTTQTAQNIEHSHKIFANTTALTNLLGAVTLPYIGRRWYRSGGVHDVRSPVSIVGFTRGNTSLEGGDARPHNIAVNYFIKVNN